MDQLALLFMLLLGAVVSVPVGDRFKLPAPVLMTLLGIVLALLDFVPNVDVAPDLILPLLLPPLLYAAVRRTSWRQFAANVRPILLLAVALGALVAPPDPVAATAVAGQLGLPRRLVSILEGEGLFNDVTAIVLYHVAIAAAVSGSFHVGEAALELVLSAVVALVVGVVLGWCANKLMDLLDDTTLQIGLTLLVPYASYVMAEELHGSGVLAVLTTALFLAEYATDPDDVATRLAGHTFWDIVDTLVTGVAFGLIGLELHNAIRTASGRWGELMGWAGAIVGVVVVVRLVWLLPATWLTKRLHAKRDSEEEIPMSWRETVVMWWSGMRGVASVALALAIPLKTDDGSAFPDRDEIIFIAFGVIMATLVLQGLTLPWLVKRLGVTADSEREKEFEKSLAVRAAKAAKRRLKEIESAEELSEELSEQMQRRAFEIGVRIYPEMGDEERREARRRLKRARRIHGEMLSAARHEVLAARSEPGADPEVVDRVLRHLDVRSLR